jgi:hypothetical protein
MEMVDSVQARAASEPQPRAATELEAPGPIERQAPVSASQGTACPMCVGAGSSSQSGLAWLAKRRGWVLLGSAAVGGTGVALGEGWVTIEGLAPLLYTLPCAVMMIFCMKGMSRGMQTTQDQTSSPPPDRNTQSQPPDRDKRATNIASDVARNGHRFTRVAVG